MSGFKNKPRGPAFGREYVSASLGHVTADDSISGWAHITPRHPDGIVDSQLQRETQSVQIETAVAWFLLNAKPYDPATGGPDFSNGPQSLNFQAYRAGDRAPSPIDALTPLREEFDGVIEDSVLKEAGDLLPGKWVWISWRANEETSRELKQNLLKVLGDLKHQVEIALPAHGGVGHNQPPDSDGITADDRTKMLDTIQELEKVIPDASADDKETLKGERTRIKTYGAQFGKFAIQKLIEGALKEAGGHLWKEYVAKIDIWALAHLAGHLIDSLVKLL